MTLSKCPRCGKYPRPSCGRENMALACPTHGCTTATRWWGRDAFVGLIAEWNAVCKRVARQMDEEAMKGKEETMKGKEDNRCCATCRHFVPIGKLEGHCRGVPPQFVGYDPRLNEPMFKFPIVVEALCCGQFKERVEVDEEEK